MPPSPVILPRNWRLAKLISTVGAGFGFCLVWIGATGLRLFFLSTVSEKSIEAGFLRFTGAMFFPELIFIAYWLLFRELPTLRRVLKHHVLAEQQDLSPDSQFVPPKRKHVLPSTLLSDSFKSGAHHALLILGPILIITLILFLLRSPSGGEPFREFAAVRSFLPEPTKSYLFPDLVESLYKNAEISARGRSLGEAIFLGQLIGIALFILLWYLGFAKQVLRKNSSFPHIIGPDPAPKFEDLRGDD